MLPIYLEHVIFPVSLKRSLCFVNHSPAGVKKKKIKVLDDAGFVTEVHHIDGEGEDAGVVYAEMQARENDAGSLAYNRFVRAIS